MTDHLNARQARAMTLRAQGFGVRRDSAETDGRALLRCVRRLGALQIDSVNVLCRAHYMPLFSRLGGYDRARLDAFNQGPPSRRRLFEYWSHEASLLPLEDYPLYRFRMQRACEGGGGLWKHLARFAREHPDYLAGALAEIERHGPLSAAELSGAGRSRGNWWGWSHGKSALEALFWCGRVLVAHRRGNFERVYDLPERVVGRLAHEVPAVPEEAQRALVERAMRAMGVATTRDVQRYFRLDGAETRQRLAELAEAGVIAPLRVEGWPDGGWRHVEARAGRHAANATALLAPFDPLMWDRERAARLFDFHYRIEIYTPQAQRRFGYYVLPFLLNGELVARLDLKADRQRSTLRVIAAHPERDQPLVELAAALSDELRRLADFLALREVSIEGSGELDRALHRERSAACHSGPDRW
ncbi:winged helix-turn-helix domain-containing protein [Kushneria aurantia]|uniref:Winged helix-turn-helix domain-containing protein n=1 Tax=Kushneria aurantia TaxID=504092 RepID=A0ABV6FZE8_9GAMM|nr:crosslink repair DNA glycosylase YcaQ family protein [Kushneria aurantia]